MTVKVETRLIPTSKNSIKAPYSMKPEYITIHNTYNDASADSEVTFMINNNNKVSYHYAIDDKKVINCVPENRNAWHCGDGSGDGNRKSIGIEICYSKSGGARYSKAEALTVKFTAQLLKKYGWGVDRVKTHKHWTELGVKAKRSTYVKNCPHRILNEGRWQSFLNAVQKELNNLNKKVDSVTNVQPSAPMWDGMIIKESQIGRVTILKPINLWKRDGDKLIFVRILQVGDVYRVYNKDNKHGGQFDLGANCWLTDMDGYVKYETPSKSKLKEVEEYYKK